MSLQHTSQVSEQNLALGTAAPPPQPTGRRGGHRKFSDAEVRREYQRRYYQMHKEKAKEYQRQYSRTHKKRARPGRGGKSATTSSREVVRSTFNTADIMHSPVEKTLKMIQKIINGERLFTM